MIPTYNQDIYLSQAIDSALMQDYSPIQVVVADDCSTDRTKEVINKYMDDQRLHYVRNTNNLGRVENYTNTLFNHVKGEWVVNLDGDDYYTDKKFISESIREVLQAKKMGKSVVAHLGNHNTDNIAKWIPESTKIESRCICCSGTSYFINYPKTGQFAHMSCIYHVETAKELGGYVIDSVAADFHALMKVFLCGDLVINEKKPGVWRIHGGNASLLNLRKKYLSAFSMYEDLSQQATPFFSENELSAWKSEMQEGAFKDYVLTSCAYAKSINDILFLLRDFRFNPVFLLACRVLFKRVLRSIGNWQ